METEYQYDPFGYRIVIANTNTPVAIAVGPEHGLMLASAPLFKSGCREIEKILRMEHLTPYERVHACRELLGMMLDSFQREQIRMLPEAPST